MNNVIEISNLTKKYNNFLLYNISFSVPGGFVSGFIGENGAGKTTTLKLLHLRKCLPEFLQILRLRLHFLPRPSY